MFFEKKYTPGVKTISPEKIGFFIFLQNVVDYKNYYEHQYKLQDNRAVSIDAIQLIYLKFASHQSFNPQPSRATITKILCRILSKDSWWVARLKRNPIEFIFDYGRIALFLQNIPQYIAVHLNKPLSWPNLPPFAHCDDLVTAETHIQRREKPYVPMRRPVPQTTRNEE
jgi:hypothetical protein